MRWEKAGPKMELLFFMLICFIPAIGQGVSALNDRKIRFYLIPGEDFEVSHFAGGAFTEAI